ncbi:uncharacterized protein LOC111291824 isoform X4 [Durio zibethinus]|uniref:Uncharacterized protein LOC111291824 isoform X4 n=1 Tax=Durio zibethinus TaxID=66656 RepID=A0A6P5YGI2_DURZI|nr:uncharacterized protein LOC111291824 isoform X4 [Durio zibethinus]
MDETFFDLMEFFKKPTITETFVDILLCAVPIWLAVMIGLVIGWSWRPRWTSLVFLGFRSKFRFIWTVPPGFGARRIWLAFSALSALSVCRTIFSKFIKGRAKKSTASDSNSAVPLLPPSPTATISPEGAAEAVSSKAEGREQDIVTENDLAHLLHFLEGKDGEMEWQSMMERTTSNMSYQAWRHEPEGVPYPGLQKHDKPRRVELYFSSWVIRAVESQKGDGQLSACEVTLVHYEDIGIPKDVAKLGVRHGMWGTVKKLHSGMRAYQNARKTDTSLSRCALMARITTKISSDESMSSLGPVSGEDEKDQTMVIRRQNDNGLDWKWIAVGGTVALVFGLYSGVIGKALLLGAGQRIGRR